MAERSAVEERDLRRAARAEGARLELALSSIEDQFYLLDHEWRYALVNDRVLEHTRKSRADLLGRRLFDVFPDTIGTRFEKELAAAAADGQPRRFEYWYKAWQRWLHHAVYPTSAGMAVLVTDVTERRQTERLANEQNNLLELIAASRPLEECMTALTAAVSRLHAETRACILLADRAREQFLSSFAAEIPSSFSSRIPGLPINDLCIGTCGEAVFRGQGVTCVDIANDERWSKPWRELCVGHGILACHSEPVSGPGGSAVASVMLCFDEPREPTEWERRIAKFGTRVVSIALQRDRSLQALRASEDRYRRLASIVQSSADFIGILDAERRVTYVNEAGLRLIGIEGVDALRGRAMTECVAECDRLRFEREIVPAALERGRWRGELSLRRLPGDRPIPVIYDMFRIDDPATGVAHSFGTVARDVTERKRAEQERESLLEAERTARSDAEAATRLKDEFLATLSHELRTPLSNVVAWGRILQKKFETRDELLKRGLAVIVDNAFAQSQLISELLDMSRIASGKVSIDPKPIDLIEIVAAATTAQLPDAEAKGLTLTLDHGVDSAVGFADPTRLQQVLWNLLSNAIKFTPAGGAIAVTTRIDGDYCEIAIRDSGEGIAAEFLPHLFDRFRQGDGGTKRRHGGLGLGLSIVKQLVEMHGGEVSARSDGPGMGSTFVLRLPTSPDPLAVSNSWRVDPEIMQAESLQGLRILAVEDQPDMLEHLKRVLEEQGAEVVTASSGAQALRELNARHRAGGFRVIVSDVGMPEMDGYELMRTVRRELKFPPEELAAVAITAFARDEDRARALGAGFQAHLVKPYQVAQLIGIVRQLGLR